ncbi:hypothetical protein, partial [Chromobacterium piscinae]|uniref:hypothetical protein n=1 Tax=Chromobacterium piscinae TaxID=686831 RepID=UPI00326012AB
MDAATSAATSQTPSDRRTTRMVKPLAKSSRSGALVSISITAVMESPHWEVRQEDEPGMPSDDRNQSSIKQLKANLRRNFLNCKDMLMYDIFIFMGGSSTGPLRATHP